MEGWAPFAWLALGGMYVFMYVRASDKSKVIRSTQGIAWGVMTRGDEPGGLSEDE